MNPQGDPCPDCGSTAVTCWDCRDAEVSDLGSQIRCLENENSRLTERCMAREEELETARRAIYAEYDEVVKNGESLLKELLQFTEERTTGTDKWSDMDLQSLSRRVGNWIKANP